MKKSIKFLLAAATLSLAAACVNELQPDIPSSQQTSVRRYVASFDESESTRTDIAAPSNKECKVTWAKGDIILYFFNDEEKHEHVVKAKGATTVIEVPAKGQDEEDPAAGNDNPNGAPVDEPELYFDAIYGASEIVEHSEGRFLVQCGVDAVQDGKFGSSHIAIAHNDTAEPGDVSFKNVTGMIKFNIDLSDVSYAVFSGNHGETLHGNGRLLLYFGQQGVPVAELAGDETSSEETKSITIKREGETISGNLYISLLPATLVEGFTLNCYNSQGVLLGSAMTYNKVEIVRNQVLYLGAVSKGVAKDLSINPLTNQFETSNCYIADATGKRYMFPATVKGNGVSVGGDQVEISPSYVAVLWENTLAKTSIKAGDVIDDILLKDGWVYFKAVSAGNALIAVTDETRNILWSWHIWVWPGFAPGYHSQTYYGTYKDESGRKLSPVIMDRNLGAYAAESTGMGDFKPYGYYYQWGRKDPLLGYSRTAGGYAGAKWPEAVASTAEIGTIEYSVKNPTTQIYGVSGSKNDWVYANNRSDLWSGAQKTMYDPCPQGWRVPADSLWYKAFCSSPDHPSTTKSIYTENISDFTKRYVDFAGYLSDRSAIYPVPGYFANTNSLQPTDNNWYGFWWTGDAATRYSVTFQLGFMKKQATTLLQMDRGRGHSVRCQLIGELPKVAVTSVNVTPQDTTLAVGATVQLKATVLPLDASDRSVTWKSSDTQHVKVDKDTGLVTVLDASYDQDLTVTVTATSVSKTSVKGTCTITVSKMSTKDLSAPLSSNCYIVSTQGPYRFKATIKGNGQATTAEESALISGGKSAGILWETFGTTSFSPYDQVLEAGSVKLEGDYIYFTAPKPLKNGNSIIALYDKEDCKGKILWTWHIWVCADYDPDTNYAKSEYVHRYYNDAGFVMDRNLGALSAAANDFLSNGLLYQWGRKDPFPGAAFASTNTDTKAAISYGYEWPAAVTTSASVGTIAYSIANPTTFICTNANVSPKVTDWCYDGNSTRWGRTKTMYDPCPPGWRVPDGGMDGLWAKAYWGTNGHDSNVVSVTTSESGGFTMTGVFSSEVVWYPDAGYLGDTSGNLLGKLQYGYYWSVDATTSGSFKRAYCLEINRPANPPQRIYPVMDFSRTYGCSVRCVHE